MENKNNKLIFTFGVIITLFFSFWKVNTFQQDVNAEVIIYPNALRCLQRAHREKTGPQIYFQQLKDRWETKVMTFRNYETAAFVQKMWLFILSIFFNIFTYSIFSINLASVIVSIAAIFFTYRLGKLLYSEEVGILSGIFLTVSIAYNIAVRSGQGHIVVTAASLVVLFYIYSYLKNGIKRDLIIAGILLGISSFEASPQFFFIPASTILVLLFNFSDKERGGIKALARNLKDITILFFLAAIVSLIITAIYARYYNITVFSIYRETYFWVKSMFYSPTHKYFNAGLLDSLKNAIIFVKNIFIGMSALDLDDYAMQLEGVPMISPLISIFFIVGLYFSTLKSKPDRLLLTCISMTFIIFMFFIRIQPRYVEIFLPLVCIVSAYGIVKIVSKIKIGKYSHIIKQIIYTIIVLAVTYAGHKNFFILYKNNDANLRRFHNNSQIAKFILKNSRPEECLVVLAENLFSCRDAVIFSMKYNPYQVFYLEELFYDKAMASNNKQYTDEDARNAIREMELWALSNNKAIYYVFSEHKIEYYFPAMVGDDQYPYVNRFKQVFLSLHPTAQPAETLRYSNGDPTHSIFIVRK